MRIKGRGDTLLNALWFKLIKKTTVVKQFEFIIFCKTGYIQQEMQNMSACMLEELTVQEMSMC